MTTVHVLTTEYMPTGHREVKVYTTAEAAAQAVIALLDVHEGEQVSTFAEAIDRLTGTHQWSVDLDECEVRL